MRLSVSFIFYILTLLISLNTKGQIIDSNVNWKAHWITATQSQSASNTWICFRKGFDVTEIPLSALSGKYLCVSWIGKISFCSNKIISEKTF